ncbi:hypothetical protein AAHB56_08305, partial [Bacillus thuringiensis]
LYFRSVSEKVGCLTFGEQTECVHFRIYRETLSRFSLRHASSSCACFVLYKTLPLSSVTNV